MISVHVEGGRVTQNLEQLGPAIEGVVNADIQQALENAKYSLGLPGKPISYPVQWDSEKQRRAYFATKGFGSGIPYQRTGAYNKGWQIEQTGYRLAREFTLSNNVKYANWVSGGPQGDMQSRIHRGRWDVASETVKKHVSQMLIDVREGINEAIRAEGLGL